MCVYFSETAVPVLTPSYTVQYLTHLSSFGGCSFSYFLHMISKGWEILFEHFLAYYHPSEKQLPIDYMLVSPNIHRVTHTYNQVSVQSSCQICFGHGCLASDQLRLLVLDSACVCVWSPAMLLSWRVVPSWHGGPVSQSHKHACHPEIEPEGPFLPLHCQLRCPFKMA